MNKIEVKKSDLFHYFKHSQFILVDGDYRMDVDASNQDLQHIPGADDTTLLSNVSDEFVLPPIATTGIVK